MHLHAIRGGTIEELKAKRYNIGVGVSLGNKWFTADNIVELTRWALAHTRDKVIIYVADSIHAINLEVRNHLRPEVALAKADKMGTDLLNAVRTKISNTFSQEDQKRILYIKWNDLTDDAYKKKLDYLYKKYREEKSFEEAILSVVRGFTSKEDRTFTGAELHRLGDYLIEEFPELLCRVKMAGIDCEAFVYPYDGEIAKLVEDVQKGTRFAEIKEAILDTEPKVFFEVR